MFGIDILQRRVFRGQNGHPHINESQSTSRYQLPRDTSSNGFTPVDLDLWPEPQHSNYANDVAVAGIGSVTNFLPEFYLGVTRRRLAASALNQVSGAATTHNDLDRLNAIAQEHPRFISSAPKGRNPERRWWHANSPQVNARSLGLGQISGLGSDPLKGSQLLTTNASLRADLEQVVEDIAASYHQHRSIGGKLVWVSSFGGNEPLSRYALAKTSTKLKVNFLVEVKIIPTQSELLSNSFARGELYRLISREVSEQHLTLVVQNIQRGVHEETDPILADAITTLTASAAHGSELDGASLLNTLRKYSCGWIETYSVAIYTPMAVGSEQYTHREEHFYNFRLPQRVGDRSLEIILQRVDELLARAKDALHVITVCGYFPNDMEVHYLKMLIEDKAPGKVVPIVNRMANPPTKDSMLRYGVTDFIAAKELPPSVFAPYRLSGLVFTRGDGMTPQEFLERVQPSDEELEKARQVQALVEQLLV